VQQEAEHEAKRKRRPKTEMLPLRPFEDISVVRRTFGSALPIPALFSVMLYDKK
jgi:hypothetical protein